MSSTQAGREPSKTANIAPVNGLSNMLRGSSLSSLESLGVQAFSSEDLKQNIMQQVNILVQVSSLSMFNYI